VSRAPKRCRSTGRFTLTCRLHHCTVPDLGLSRAQRRPQSWAERPQRSTASSAHATWVTPNRMTWSAGLRSRILGSRVQPTSSGPKASGSEAFSKEDMASAHKTEHSEVTAPRATASQLPFFYALRVRQAMHCLVQPSLLIPSFVYFARKTQWIVLSQPTISAHSLTGSFFSSRASSPPSSKPPRQKRINNNHSPRPSSTIQEVVFFHLKVHRLLQTR